LQLQNAFLASTLVGSAGAALTTLRNDNDKTTARALSSIEIDFSAFSAGDVVSSLGDGVTVTAHKALNKGAVKNSNALKIVPGQAMIFDSLNPTGGDVDLGAPNQDFGGVGIGKGGKAGKLFANTVEHGKILIISQDENAQDPNDNQYGGIMEFDFDPPRYVDSIGYLDNDENVAFEINLCNGETAYNLMGKVGDNSFERVAVGKPHVCKITAYLYGSGAITDIRFAPAPCTAKKLFDLETFSAGDIPFALGGGIFVAATIAPSVNGTVMIFDSAHPGPLDLDLGTP
jgi:hypothetical protein